MELVQKRLELGRKKYGHGVRVRDNPQTWGTLRDSWMDMAQEEFLDGIVYVLADFIREIGVGGSHGCEDDNRLIMFYLKNPNLIDSEKHKRMITILLECCELCE